MRCCIVSVVALGAAPLLLASADARAATVWSGYDHVFSKANGVDPISPGAQDLVTPGVAITRLNTGQGLINAATETSFIGAVSPSGTLWAFPATNQGVTVAASNWANLVFLPWTTAFGGNGAGGPPSTVGQPSVMKVVASDLYVDVRLTAWTVRLGGGFAYERASGPARGDYNGDGLVNQGDYAVWSSAYGGAAGPADGNADGAVNAADYTVWRDAATDPPPAQVPEPVAALVFATGLAVMPACRAWIYRKSINRSC
ncbi:MAG: hypothetical protein ACRCT8_00860 [Lacipirellulaceae bacterium]